MPNVPIVTELTKLQLDALVAANGLNDGLQYKVTDKNWLLIATSNALLKPLYEYLVIADAEIPAYIIVNNVVFVGLCDFSIVVPYDLPIFNDFFVTRIEINVLNDEEILGLTIPYSGTYVDWAGKKIVNILDPILSPNSSISFVSLTDQSAFPFKFAVHYKKLYSL